jgi:hypothetical protein
MAQPNAELGVFGTNERAGREEITSMRLEDSRDVGVARELVKPHKQTAFEKNEQAPHAQPKAQTSERLSVGRRNRKRMDVRLLKGIE